MERKQTTNVLLIIVILVLVTSCSLNGNNHDQLESENREVNIISKDINDMGLVIEAESRSLIYITTNWCNGGALTINSYIYPKLQELNDHEVKIFIIYFGAELRNDIIPDSHEYDRFITIYHISNSLFDNAFVHKYRIKSFLEQLDSSYQFSDAIPVTALYENGELRKIKPSEIDVILKSD